MDEDRKAFGCLPVFFFIFKNTFPRSRFPEERPKSVMASHAATHQFCIVVFLFITEEKANTNYFFFTSKGGLCCVSPENNSF